MRIGEFAEICGTKISVLRHYDKQNILKPEYVDNFTGYRYYSKEQMTVFFRISALKKAGFSLAEISSILSEVKNDEDIFTLFDRKKAEVYQTLYNLEEAKKIILEGRMCTMKDISIVETENGICAKSGRYDDSVDFDEICNRMEKLIAAQDYQRVSSYTAHGEQYISQEQYGCMMEVVCDVVKLNAKMNPLNESLDYPFEDDPEIVGKWETIGEYPVKKDFYAGRFCDNSWFGKVVKEIYFLPQGKGYWVFRGWTKGLLLMESGVCSSANSYEIEEHDGGRYMFINHKSYNYRRGGRPTVIVLRQVDNKEYSSWNIARKDNLDMPFVNDELIIGKWESIDYCRDKDDWMPRKPSWGQEPQLFFKEITFLENGSCTSVYGTETISGDHRQVWTKGYVLRKYNQTACAYEIRRVNGMDYLILEWKSGDYIWGGLDTDYYIFARKTTPVGTS